MLIALLALEGKKDMIFFTWHVENFISFFWPFNFIPMLYLQFLSIVTALVYFPGYMKSDLKWFFSCLSMVPIYLFNEKLHPLLWHSNINV